MRAKTTLLAIAAIATATQLGTGAEAARATTTPGVVYTLKVVLTNTSISIAHDKFARNGISRYPRGAVIHYTIVNKGNRPYTFRIWDKETAPIRPSGHDSVLINWNYRGAFTYDTLLGQKPAGPKGKVIVF